MQSDHDEMLVRAELAAVLSLGGYFLPSIRVQMLEVACRAAIKEQATLDRTVLTLEQQESRIRQAARVAVWAAMLRRSLIEEVQALPHAPRLALSLQCEHDMNDTEIASVLSRTGVVPGCTPEQAKALIAQAVELLGQR